MTVGKRIQEKRKLKGLTQKQLANQLNVATGTIQQYELGKRTPKIETIKMIASALEVTPFDLVGPEWFDMQLGPEKLKELNQAVKSAEAIISILTEIYGHVESKDIYGDSDYTGHYYLVGKEPNTFVLYDGDLSALLNSTKAALPALVDRMKDIRSESEIIQDYLNELNSMPTPEGE